MDEIEKKIIDEEYYVSYDLFNKVFWDNEDNKRKLERLETKYDKMKQLIINLVKDAEEIMSIDNRHLESALRILAGGNLDDNLTNKGMS